MTDKTLKIYRVAFILICIYTILGIRKLVIDGPPIDADINPLVWHAVILIIVTIFIPSVIFQLIAYRRIRVGSQVSLYIKIVNIFFLLLWIINLLPSKESDYSVWVICLGPFLILSLTTTILSLKKERL